MRKRQLLIASLLIFGLAALLYLATVSFYPSPVPDLYNTLLIIAAAVGGSVAFLAGFKDVIELVAHLTQSSKSREPIRQSTSMTTDKEHENSSQSSKLVNGAANTNDQYHSCFISFSSTDEVFARKLLAELQRCGVDAWFAPDDMKIGDKIRPTLDTEITRHNKLLLILSKDSIDSDWVEQEVETALAYERQFRVLVLFPIRVDEAVMNIKVGWPALVRNTRQIGDFRNWQDKSGYQQAVARLLNDLKR